MCHINFVWLVCEYDEHKKLKNYQYVQTDH